MPAATGYWRRPRRARSTRSRSVSMRCNGTFARRMVCASAVSRSSTPARYRARNSGSLESTISCSPVSASSTTIRPASGNSSSLASMTRNATTSWRCTSRSSCLSQSPRADEVRHHDDQRPPPGHGRGSVEHRREVGAYSAIGASRWRGRVRGRCAVRAPRPVPGGTMRAVAPSWRIAPTRLPPRPNSRARISASSASTSPLPRPGRAGGHRGRSVEHQPHGQVAIFDELPHLRAVQPRGGVPVDVAGVVGLDVFAQAGEVHPRTAVGRAVAALDPPVDASEHAPLEAQQQAVGGGRHGSAGLQHNLGHRHGPQHRRR